MTDSPSTKRSRTKGESERLDGWASAQEDDLHTRLDPETPQTTSPAYRLGFADPDFLLRDELRPSRLQLEYLKPEILQRERGIAATVVFLGSARIPDPETAQALLDKAKSAAAQNPDDREAEREVAAAEALVTKCGFYEQARELAQIISRSQSDPAACETARGRRRRRKVVVVTGGGPGIMEAANRGADDVGAESVGLNIVLPFEQRPNAYVTPHLCFNFHYFALRKFHFLMRARAIVVFPGGFGTLDELFEVLCLVQTQKIKPMPVLLFGREYWEKIIDFSALAAEGVIAPEDLDIFSYVESAEEAWQLLQPILAGDSERR